MKKTILLFSVMFLFVVTLQAQNPIEAVNMATYNAYLGAAADSAMPYFKDLGVRRVIVADADGDGTQEIILGPVHSRLFGLLLFRKQQADPHQDSQGLAIAMVMEIRKLFLNKTVKPE